MRYVRGVVGPVAVAVLVAVAVAGCSSGEGGDAGAASGGSDLTFMSGGGNYQDAQDQAFIRPFEKAEGVTVHDDTTLSYAKIQTMVDAGNVTVDVIPAEGYWAVQQCGKLLEPLDKSIVDLDGIDPALTQSECAAPLLTYETALYYNTDTFSGSDTPQGCKDFFDTERFPGKRAVYSSPLPNAVIECALIADGVAPDELYPADIERAMKKIESIEDDLVFWNSGADSAELMVAGEVAMILAWNGRAYAAIGEENARFAPAYGEAFLVYDAAVVPKGVSDPQLAMKLVDFMMDPQRQAKLTTLIPYGPAHTEAKLTGLPPKLEEFLPETNPKLKQAMIVQDQQWWAENADAISERWQETFQG